jgi:hypothetical protein
MGSITPLLLLGAITTAGLYLFDLKTLAVAMALATAVLIFDQARKTGLIKFTPGSTSHMLLAGVGIILLAATFITIPAIILGTITLILALLPLTVFLAALALIVLALKR